MMHQENLHQDNMMLIQAGVDGELDAAGKAELSALLESSEAAREHHETLIRLAAFLDQVPSLDPPDSLHGQIVNSITLPSAGKGALSGIMDWIPAFFRYGLAATAAVVLTMAVYQSGSQLDGMEYDSLVGTIASRGTELDRFDFTQSTVSGSVRLLERKGYLALEFDLQAEGLVQFDVDFSNSGLRFDAFTQDNLNLEAVSLTRTSLSAQTLGSQRFLMLMRRDDEPVTGAPRINLELSRDGTTLERGALETRSDS